MLLIDGNQFHNFLSTVDFYLTDRNPPINQVKPVSEYLDCFLEFEVLELFGPKTLTSWNFIFMAQTTAANVIVFKVKSLNMSPFSFCSCIIYSFCLFMLVELLL